MSEEKELHSVHSDMPIFVLKYRTGSKILHLMAWMILAIMFYARAFELSPYENTLKESFMRAGIFLCFLAMCYLLIDLILFKEIRLYEDRIAKVWHFLGSREILLSEAQLKGTNLLHRWRKIYTVKAGLLKRYMGVIFYLEDMATKDDAKAMNKVMAQVVGRDEEDFETIRLNMNPLLKNANK